MKLETYRKDHRSGIIASTIANVHRGKNQKQFKAQDFMLSPDITKENEPEVLTPEQLLRKFKSEMGKKIKKRNG